MEGKKPNRKSKIPVRKRFKHVKRHVQKPLSGEPLAEPCSPDASVSACASASLQCDAFETVAGSSSEIQSELNIVIPTPMALSSFTPQTKDHSYSFLSPTSSKSPSPGPLSRPSSSLSCISSNLSVSVADICEDLEVSDVSVGVLSPIPGSCGFAVNPAVPEFPAQDVSNIRDLLLDVRAKLMLMLPDHFLPCVDNDGIHVLMVGSQKTKAVQRQIFVSSSGTVRVLVHNEDFPAHIILDGIREQMQLSQESIGHFADRIMDIVSKLRLFEVCAGMDEQEFKEAWPITPQGMIETDTFRECRYKETFRSVKCSLLVKVKDWRCKECTKLKPFLKRKLQSMQVREPSKFTNIRYLAEKQKDDRLSNQQKVIKTQKQKIERMQLKMKEMIDKEGIQIESCLSEDLRNILISANLSETQSLFLQQQMKASQCKKSSGMRWHSTLIRLALSIYLKAPGAYKDLCNSGFMKLPSSRTLFDYSHVTKVEPGIDTSTVQVAANRAKSNEEKVKHKQYHVLMADEMHISKNLVSLKSTGDLIGFKDLDDLDQEVTELEGLIDDPDKCDKHDPQIATKVLAYMIKGVSSNLKHVVASYPVVNPSPKQIYLWTWDVIGALERSGVRVIAFVGDGCSANRAFFKLHKPATVLPSGVVFDTVNKFAPERLFCFFSDVPHLLKTMRNAFYNSRRRKKNVKNSTRLLKKNGEEIVWDTIIRLYLAKKDLTLRKSFKLNAQNVFPDSYSRMKVKLAAEIWSSSVGHDILSQGWAKTSETVELILKVNNWFELLNGASSTQGMKKNNRNLDPYTMQDVENFENSVEGNRFKELLNFLQYLDDWKAEVQNEMNVSFSSSVVQDTSINLGDEPPGGHGSLHVLDDTYDEREEEAEHYSKHIFPQQTLVGIEMSVRAFIGATTFLLKEGVSFINARVYCQDPLEQNFGRQRQAGGGSQAPNFSQYLHKQRGFSIIGELSAARSSGNTEVVKEKVEVTVEPLPKRQKKK